MRGPMLRPTATSAQIVAGWLGAPPSASSSTNVDLPDFVPRAERLGLGHSYVPHSAALGVDSALARKTMPKLSREDKEREREDAENERLRQAPKSKQKKGQPQRLPQATAADDSEDDGEGRSSSVRSKKRPRR